MDNMNMELINFLIERYYLSLPLLIVIFLLIYSSSTKGGNKISPQFLISLANNENAFIVDLRNSELFNQGRITGSINIPFNNLSKRFNEIPENNKSIVLVCDMGNVSPNAGELLKKEGYKDILILRAGVNEWKLQNLPLI